MDSEGLWHFSPAYDMGYAYNSDGAWTSKHQMSVNGKYDEITREDLLELASRNNIKMATQIIEEVCDACGQWPQIAQECDVPKTMIDKVYPNMLLGIWKK